MTDAAPIHRRISFRVNDVELGLHPSSTVNIDPAGRLTAELHASAIPPVAQDWMLHPPMLYARRLAVPPTGTVTIDDELLDDCDIGLYVGTHCDILGTLTVTDKQVRISGSAPIDRHTIWHLDVRSPATRG